MIGIILLVVGLFIVNYLYSRYIAYTMNNNTKKYDECMGNFQRRLKILESKK